MPFSVLYECAGNVNQIGPFDTEAEADDAAKQAHASGEFNIFFQRVYLMHPNHRLVEYSESDVLSQQEIEQIAKRFGSPG